MADQPAIGLRIDRRVAGEIALIPARAVGNGHRRQRITGWRGGQLNRAPRVAHEKIWGIDNHPVFATMLVTIPVSLPESAKNPAIDNRACDHATLSWWSDNP
jgi:hypothetical protein